MSPPTKNEKITPLISQQQISARVAELATQINRDYAGRDVTLLATLSGSSIFHADLARAITQYQPSKTLADDEQKRAASGAFFATEEVSVLRVGINVHLDFMKVSSYGSGTKSTGVVEMTFPPSLPIEGRHIIIVEDIIDTGHTAACLAEYFKNKNAASYQFCTFLNKPARREVPNIECKYIGFDVDDVFVVGYGLDYDQRYRNLPYVAELEFS